MSWQTWLGPIFLASSVIAVAVVNWRNNSTRQTIQNQADLIVTLQAEQEVHGRLLTEQKSKITELEGKVAVLETIPLDSINGNLAEIARAQSVFIKGQTQMLKLLREMRTQSAP